eukprot:GHVP01049267.1.p1 GENE.GHVP01049267.1~~GHVP01049267.1.p1  ORF type:complete len:182 (-),score=25.98 GHVP01049267.1:70-615(-)
MKVHSANQTINSIDRVSTFFSQYYVPLQTLDKGMRDLMPLVREIYDFYNQKYSYLLFGRDLGVSTELFDGADSLRAIMKAATEAGKQKILLQQPMNTIGFTSNKKYRTISHKTVYDMDSDFKSFEQATRKFLDIQLPLSLEYTQLKTKNRELFVKKRDKFKSLKSLIKAQYQLLRDFSKEP